MLSRFLILWCVLHIILLVVEIIRYQYSNTMLKFKYYFEDRLLGITYIVLVFDGLMCLATIGYVCYNYITKGVLI